MELARPGLKGHDKPGITQAQFRDFDAHGGDEGIVGEAGPDGGLLFGGEGLVSLPA